MQHVYRFDIETYKLFLIYMPKIDVNEGIS